MTPRRTFRLLTPALSALVAVAVIEAIVVPLGLFVPAEFHDRHQTLFGLFQPDPELGFRARSNLRDFEVSWRGNQLTGRYSTDEFGFRNVGRSYSDSEIFFIGDSFTWGAWVPREETFVDLAGAELGRNVSNLGQESYYIEQYEKVLRQFSERGRPEHIAICVFANDLTAPMSDDDFKNFYSRFGWDQYRSFPLYKKLFTYNAALFLKGLLGAVPGVDEPPAPSHLDRKTAARGMEFYRQLGAHPAYYSQGFNEPAERSLRNLLAYAVSRADRVNLFLLPSKESAYKDEYLELFPGDYLEIEESAYRRFCEIAGDMDVACLDLTPAFRETSKQADTYFLEDPHWNRAGHRVAARVIAEALR